MGLVFIATSQIPNTLGYYYLSRGGDILDEGLSSGSIPTSDRSFCLPLQNNNQLTRNQIREAVSFLEKARRYNPNISNLNLLLSRAYCSLGQSATAISYLKAYIQQKPDNPLGHLELGFAYKQAGDTKNAKKQWELAGITSDEITKIKKLNWNDEGLSVEYENYQVLDSFATLESWSPHPDNSEGSIYAENGRMVMTYENNIDRRDVFGFSRSPQTDILTFRELLIRMRATPGTLFTFETVIDGVRKREINYQPVSEEWVIQTIPISGKRLNILSMGIGELNATPLPDHYELNVDWIVIK